MSGDWVRLWLPEGRSTLIVQRGSHTARLSLDAGYQPALAAFGSPDAAECVEVTRALLARRVDAGVLSCPSDALRADDLQALSRTLEFLRERGVRSLHLIGDRSVRSLDAQRELRNIAGANGMTVDGPDPEAELIVSGWAGAAAELQALRGRPEPVDGVYLAPWLLTAPLVSSASSVATLTPLPFDPSAADATAYAVRLSRLWPGATPTPSGFRAYTGRADSNVSVRLYASAVVSVLPASLGHLHSGAASWLPGGAITPISRPLRAHP